MPDTLFPESPLDAAIESACAKLCSQFPELDAEMLLVDLKDRMGIRQLSLKTQTRELKSAIGISVPFYASSTLAKYARYADDLTPAGERILFGMIEHPKYGIGLVSGERHANIVGADLEDDEIWSRWARSDQAAVCVAKASRAEIDPVDSTPRIAVAGLEKAWWAAFEPAAAHAMKFLGDGQMKKALKMLRAELQEPVELVLMARARQILDVVGQSLDHAAITSVATKGFATLGAYNYLTRGPASEANLERYALFRSQSLEALGNLRPMLVDFSIPSPVSFENQLRNLVDGGGRIYEWVAGQFGIRESGVKAFVNLPIAAIDQMKSTSIREVMETYFSMIRTLPPGRIPKTAEDLEIALSFVGHFETVERISKLMGTTAADLWEGALKGGWKGLVKDLSAMRIIDRQPHPPSIPVAGAMLDEGLRALDLVTEIVRRVRARYPAQGEKDDAETNAKLAGVLLRGKTIRGLGEISSAAQKLMIEAEAADSEAIKQFAARDYEWTPILPGDRTLQLRDGVVRELVTQRELSAEGSAMSHCVGSYGYNIQCLRHGSRIFSFEAAGQRPGANSHRATLEIRLTAEPGDGGFRPAQFFTYSDRTPEGPLVSMRGEFFDGLRNGSITWNPNAHAQDRAVEFAVNKPNSNIEMRLAEFYNEHGGDLLPRDQRATKLIEYLRGAEFKQRFDAIYAVEPEPELAPT